MTASGEQDRSGAFLMGAVLIGGQSSRFGSDKALALVDGRPMGAVVVDALRDGGADPVVAVGGSAGPSIGVPTVADRRPGEGPLAALATVLTWARSGMVVVCPCDLPLLRGSHVAELAAAAGPDRAAVAVTGGRSQPSLACWPATAGPAVARLVAEGARAWRQALDVVDWTGVAIDPRALDDADTPDELDAIVGREPGRP